MSPDEDPAVLAAHWEEQLEQVHRTGRRLRSMAVTESIGRGVGTVVADGYGNLREIRIDRDAMQVIDEQTLGRKVVDAVNKVEAKAAAIRERAER